MSGLDWVPASCTLPTEEHPLRVRLVLRGGGGVEERVRDLAEREGGCCSFFTFAVAADGGAVVLDVSVDAVHTADLDALVRRAGAVGRQR